MKYLLMLMLSACVSSDTNKAAVEKNNCKDLCAPFPYVYKEADGYNYSSCKCNLRKYYDEMKD